MTDVLGLEWGSYLDSGIDEADDSLTLVDVATGQISADDHILIGNEVIQVGGVSGANLTGLTRGAGATGHGAGARVYKAITDADLGGGPEANDPSAGEKAALAGTSGTPGSGNKYVTDGDSRNTNARTPTSHATSHSNGGGDEITVENLGTAETDTSKRLAPDGAGGLAWGTGGGGGLTDHTHAATGSGATGGGDTLSPVTLNIPSSSFGAVTAQTAYGASSGNGSASTAAHSDHTHGTVGHDAYSNLTGIPSTFAPSAHDHTGSSDGGVLTNDEHDGYVLLDEIAAPSSPAGNTARLYARDKSGVTELFYKNDAGAERDLSAVTYVTGATDEFLVYFGW